ncbi:MAG: hypothetical protein IJQ90_04810 [Alphaproteobacteria bacterium]|nr:hypothetical protein [Alphaproteobacteria bacterium]
MFWTPVVAHATTVDAECAVFNPAFALCSTHAHNVAFKADGLPANPTNAEDIAYMNEVIALKSTVIAQQLKEQYDALNAIIKRFKTQLEKAVLTSKIEVLTGNSASGNSGGGASGSYNNNGLANAEDCYAVSQENAYDCVARNLSKISSAAEKDITNARKQLDNDLAIMKGYDMCGTNTNCLEAVCSKSRVSSMNKTDIQSCVKNLQLKIRGAKSDFDRQNAQARWGRY